MALRQSVSQNPILPSIRVNPWLAFFAFGIFVAAASPWPDLLTVARIDQDERRAYCSVMTAIAEKLDRKLSDWKPETASEVEKLVAEIIDWADADALDLMRSRRLEQEVLDVIDAD